MVYHIFTYVTRTVRSADADMRCRGTFSSLSKLGFRHLIFGLLHYISIQIII